MTYALQMIAAHPWYAAETRGIEAEPFEQFLSLFDAVAQPVDRTKHTCEDCQNFRWQNQEDGQGMCVAHLVTMPSDRPSGSFIVEHPITYANDAVCDDFYAGEF